MWRPKLASLTGMMGAELCEVQTLNSPPPSTVSQADRWMPVLTHARKIGGIWKTDSMQISHCEPVYSPQMYIYSLLVCFNVFTSGLRTSVTPLSICHKIGLHKIKFYWDQQLTLCPTADNFQDHSLKSTVQIYTVSPNPTSQCFACFGLEFPSHPTTLPTSPFYPFSLSLKQFGERKKEKSEHVRRNLHCAGRSFWSSLSLLFSFEKW